MKTGIAGFVALAATLLVAGSASGATIVVDTTKDADAGVNACKLRSAITAAVEDTAKFGCTAGSGSDVIKLPGGVYEVSSVGANDEIENANAGGDLDVSSDDDITIEAATPSDKPIIDAGETRRAFDVPGIKDGKLTLRNLEIRNGRAPSENGGALRINSDFVLDGVTMFGNRAENGGAIAVASGAKGLILNSTISGGRATNGGGIYGFSSAAVEIRSSTITGNEAANGGGVATKENSTLSLVNTVNAGNDDTTDENASPDCDTTAGYSARFVITSQKIGEGKCLAAPTSASNLLVTDPGLLAIFDNGGPARTHLPKADSPVLLAGGKAAPDLCPSVDQRGTVRPEGRCDIGAVQISGPLEETGPDCAKEPLSKGCHFGPIAGPTADTATLAGPGLLRVKLKCPARFKPRCFSRAVPVTVAGFRTVTRGKKKVRVAKGLPMASVKRISTRSGGWKTVTFSIKPAFQARVAAMLTSDAKRLVIRQQIRSKRVGSRKHKGTTTTFQRLKVRVQA